MPTDAELDTVRHRGFGIRSNRGWHGFWHLLGRQGVAHRLLFAILLFSSFVTLLSTGTQLYLDYRNDVSAIESRFDEIEHSYLASLAVSLWNVNTGQIKIQLDGILRLPDMQALTVREIVPGVARPLEVKVGHPQSNAAIVRDFPIIYRDHDIDRTIGMLSVEATLSGVYNRLYNKGVVILVSQGIKTFLVSMFILFIVHRLVTRHLIAIADYLDDHDRRAAPLRLALHRTQPKAGDELDKMVHSFNALSSDLYAANCELAGANAELEQDLAIRQAKERELEQMVQQLVTANSALNRFAYIASHDLQEPLRSITSFVQLLARRYGGRLDSEADDYIDFVVKAAKRMHDLINDLLVFSRVEGKDAPLQVISSQAACDDAMQNLRETIQESGAEISVGPLPDILADPVQLMDVFQNLIGNAIKFRHPTKRPAISITATPDNGMWRFAIADDGIGIGDHQQDVFEIFRRLHNSAQFPGTGIGLAICKAIIVRHNGHIWHGPTAGGGTTFYFTLQGQTGPSSSAPAGSNAAPASSGTRHLRCFPPGKAALASVGRCRKFDL